MLKKITPLFIALVFISRIMVYAGEGMWLPLLLKNLNETDMQAKGMKLNAEDIYSINQSSLKDAIVSFGGFCTGEMISPDGLLLTNHHCGYGQVQSHSSVGNDLLTNGFWAMDREEELPNPGLFVSFIVRIDDVTEEILGGLNQQIDKDQKEAIIETRIQEITYNAVKGTHYGAIVKPFFYGNEYYLFITETFNDIRLVGAPPSSIGKFGGNTDNWMWPRHTGDFALFRVYAGPDGKPAGYNENNVPLNPKHHLPVSLNGIQKDDFTLVFGFPGRTNEYLTSYAIENLVNETNPHRINIREEKLKILEEDMKASDEVRIKYASKYARTANYYKKWIGENRGLKRLNAIQKKQMLESDFLEWVNANPERQDYYGDLMQNFKAVYEKQEQVNLPNTYIWEAVYGTEIIRLASKLSVLAGNFTEDELDKELDYLKKYVKKYFKDYHRPTDEKIFAALMGLYLKNVEAAYRPKSLMKAARKYENDFDLYARQLFDGSLLASEQQLMGVLDNFDTKNKKVLLKDPAMLLRDEFSKIYAEKIVPVVSEVEEEAWKLSRMYMEGLRKMKSDQKFYPDANGTLRIAYGKVDDYEPKDGVIYEYYTTLEGVMEKEDPSVDEFLVPEKLKHLYAAKDYGKYGVNGELPVCFIASNHTTGGNSGSPVINAKGQLIGINFDRNWEGTMSDIMYDPEMCRNISVDIRYVLFIIDKFAGAGHLVQEMTLITDEDILQEEQVVEEME